MAISGKSNKDDQQKVFNSEATGQNVHVPAENGFAKRKRDGLAERCGKITRRNNSSSVLKNYCMIITCLTLFDLGSILPVNGVSFGGKAWLLFPKIPS
jgi:hypothetical protein